MIIEEVDAEVPATVGRCGRQMVAKKTAELPAVGDHVVFTRKFLFATAASMRQAYEDTLALRVAVIQNPTMRWGVPPPPPPEIVAKEFVAEGMEGVVEEIRLIDARPLPLALSNDIAKVRVEGNTYSVPMNHLMVTKRADVVDADSSSSDNGSALDLLDGGANYQSDGLGESVDIGASEVDDVFARYLAEKSKRRKVEESNGSDCNSPTLPLPPQPQSPPVCEGCR